MLPRDVGLVIGHTGAAAGDRVLDAGTGTGILAVSLGQLGADVVTYERDPAFADVARENVRVAGVADRVDVRTGDLAAALDARDGSVDAGADDGDGPDPDPEVDPEPEPEPPAGTFDLCTLDTGDAPALIPRVADLLVPGGYLAAYVPFVEGTRAAVEAAREAGLDPTTYETIQRELDVGDRGTRPSTAGVGHTGYLTVGRR
jgi:tRNA (adenine57-N1/adenine58-N1)-methyltransferase